MIVEVIAVGTELLLGQIVNGNGAVIGGALAEHGLDAHHQQVVGDNLERIERSIRAATGRADAVILTGGIGPTQDDMTREAICTATGRAMAHSAEQEEQLRELWRRRGRPMPLSNLRQADYPEGAELLANTRGTAPGLALHHEGTWIFAVPGVPEEMVGLLHDHVIPRLLAAAGGESVLVSRLLRVWGSSESMVAEQLGDLYTGSTNPSIAFLASAGEIKVRITAKAPGEEEARNLIEPVEREVRHRLGEAVFGADTETIEVVVMGLLEERGWTIGTAESVTGGGVAARITSVAGASKAYRGSVVAYAPDVKQSLLGVTDLSAGVVSEPTALAMAEGARRALGVDVAVSSTGSAGPGIYEREPGTVIIGVATPERSGSRTLVLPGDRERVRTYAGTAALQLIRLALVGRWWPEE